MGRRTALTEDKQAEAMVMSSQGESCRKIAAALGVGKSSVSRFINGEGSYAKFHASTERTEDSGLGG